MAIKRAPIPIDIIPSSTNATSGESRGDSGYESSWPSLTEAAITNHGRRKSGLHHANLSGDLSSTISSSCGDHFLNLHHSRHSSTNHLHNSFDYQTGISSDSSDHGGSFNAATAGNSRKAKNKNKNKTKHSSNQTLNLSTSTSSNISGGNHLIPLNSSSSNSSNNNSKAKGGKRNKRNRFRLHSQSYHRKQSRIPAEPLVDLTSPLMEDEYEDYGPPEPSVPLSVMPRRWLYEEQDVGSVADDELVAFPKREWIYTSNGTPSLDAKSFVVMTWNLLSPRLCHPMRLHLSCDPDHLAWEYRRQTIMDQIAHHDADIICLQELELADFQEYFNPKLERLGYKSIHAVKTNLYELRDGCAIFYRDSRFRLLDHHIVRYNQTMRHHDLHDQPTTMLRDLAIRFNLFHNLAIVAHFQNRRTNRVFQLANTHLLADENFSDAKLLQTAILTAKLEEFKAGLVNGTIGGTGGGEVDTSSAFSSSVDHEAKLYTWTSADSKRTSAVSSAPSSPESSSSAPSPSSSSSSPSSLSSSSSSTSPSLSVSPSSTSTSSNHSNRITCNSGHGLGLGQSGVRIQDIPTILAGDFNSTPDSAVVRFLKTGCVETSCFGGHDFGQFTAGSRKYLYHSLDLNDSYRSSVLPFTNSTRHFQGTIDYMMFGNKSLGLVGFLDHFEPEMDDDYDDKEDALEDKLPVSSTTTSALSAVPLYSQLASKGLPPRLPSIADPVVPAVKQHQQFRSKPVSRAPFPSALPNALFPSDHIPLVAVFKERDLPNNNNNNHRL